MSTLGLEQEIINHMEVFDDYCNKSLERDVRSFAFKHKQPGPGREYDLEDVRSHAKVEVIKSVRNKYNKKGLPADHNPKHYVGKIVRTCIKGFIMKQGDYIMGNKRLFDDNKNKLEIERETGKYNLGLFIDEMKYCEVREIFRKHLNIKQETIIHHTCNKRSNIEIAKLLHITPDHVRKLFKQSEAILVNALTTMH